MQSSVLMRILAAVAGALALFMALAFAGILLFQFRYLGRIYPGVSVGGVDLSGVRRTQAAELLRGEMTYPTTGSIVLSHGGQSWDFTPSELGLTLDAEASAEAAYKVGRDTLFGLRWLRQIQVWQQGEALQPVYVLDGRAAQLALDTIGWQINQPVKEASLGVVNGEVISEAGQVGRSLDVQAAVNELEALFRTFQSGEIQLVMVERKPQVLDVQAQADLARRILSEPIILDIAGRINGDPGPWTLDQAAVADMLSIQRVEVDGVVTYQVGLDAVRLRAILEPLAPTLVREPENARFIFNDETRQLEAIQPSINGRRLLVEESIQAINQQLGEGRHTVALAFDQHAPEVPDTATGADLGITELVVEQTTYFYGSSEGRIQNIQTAGGRFHGLLVAPGEVFSMVANIGDISLDSGFTEAWIIYGDRTIKGVGGGVCQVSTTLFRAAFFGGFPIVERYSHSYRVYYYELAASGAVNSNLAGLDATVYAPIVDFKFQNDTPYWLLMEVYVNPGARSITWKFYSTSDGRQVEWDTSGLQNVTDPLEPVYEESDELGAGEVKQVDWAVEGADVVVTRKVIRDGVVLYDDVFATHYEPWATVCQYGPGTRNYPPKPNQQDTYSCKRVVTGN